MKTNTSKKDGEEGLNNLLNLTKKKKDTLKDKHKEIRKEISKIIGAFKWIKIKGCVAYTHIIN